MSRTRKYILYFMPIALLLFLILTLIVPYLLFQFTSKDIDAAKKHQVLVIGHRGASGYAPENTLASFSKALELGVDMIELDVHLTKDDSVVIMHDYQVKRTTNGEGEIGLMTFTELKKLDAGSWFDPKYANERIPALSEVLDLVKGRCRVLIELKWPSNGLYSKLAEKTIHIIREHNAVSWASLQSFETSYLIEAEKIAPDIQQQQLIFGESSILPIFYDRIPRLGKFKPLSFSRSVNVFYLYAGKNFIKKMHHENKSVFAFTPNNETDMRKLVHLQIDGLITNYPDKALRILGR